MSSQANELEASIEEFIREKRYLLNVSERTIEWYEGAFKWLRKYCPDGVTQGGISRMVVGMREHGLKPITCNSNIRVIKTYLKWKGADLKLQYLKVEQKEVQIFKPEDISRLVRFKPRTKNDRRVHLLCLLLLDTGLRLEEALGTKATEFDLDSLLVTVRGKGNKQRRIPFSIELRKAVYAGIKPSLANPVYVFSTAHGTKLSRRNALRDFKSLCFKAGVTPPPRALHALRHTFACEYLRNGGNLFYLSKVLGHSKVSTTQIYLSAVQPSELQAVHQRLSPLARC